MNPFRKILRGVVVGGLWLLALGGASYGGLLINLHIGREDAHERAHKWADISDKDAAIVASDGLVAVFGQGTAARIAPVGDPVKVTVAGGRREWRFRYRVPGGAFNDPQQTCVFVWRQESGEGYWYSHHITVQNCA